MGGCTHLERSGLLLSPVPAFILDGFIQMNDAVAACNFAFHVHDADNVNNGTAGFAVRACSLSCAPWHDAYFRHLLGLLL